MFHSYVLSYPLKPRDAVLPTPSDGTWKPGSEHLQLSLPMPDAAAGHIQAEATDAEQRVGYTLRSSSTPMSTHYAIAVLRPNGLHLSPVQGILSMRPDLSGAKSLGAGMDEEPIVSTGPAPAAAAVASTVRRATSARVHDHVRRTHAYEQRLISEEPGVQLEVHGIGSADAAVDAERLECTSFFGKAAASAAGSTLSAVQYMDAYDPATVPTLGHRGAEAVTLSSAPTDADAVNPRTMTITKLVLQPMRIVAQELLRRATCLPYARIKSVLPAGHSDQEVLQALHACGTLVRGIWVLKSDLWVESYLAEHGAHPGSAGENLANEHGRVRAIAARDFMLLHFTRADELHRAALVHATGVASGLARAMLKGVAIAPAVGPNILASGPGPSAGEPGPRVWQFKYQDDFDFQDEHAALCRVMDDWWESREKTLLTLFNKATAGTPELWQARAMRNHFHAQTAKHAATPAERAAADPANQEFLAVFAGSVASAGEDGVDAGSSAAAAAAQGGASLYSEVADVSHMLSGSKRLSEAQMTAMCRVLQDVFKAHSIVSLEYLAAALREVGSLAVDSSLSAEAANAQRPALVQAARNTANPLAAVLTLSKLRLLRILQSLLEGQAGDPPVDNFSEASLDSIDLVQAVQLPAHDGSEHIPRSAAVAALPPAWFVGSRRAETQDCSTVEQAVTVLLGQREYGVWHADQPGAALMKLVLSIFADGHSSVKRADLRRRWQAEMNTPFPKDSEYSSVLKQVAISDPKSGWIRRSGHHHGGESPWTW